MLKTRFEAKQYLIQQAKIKLHIETQETLREMLKSLNEKDFDKVQGITIEYLGEFSIYLIKVEFILDDIFFITSEEYDGCISKYPMKYFSQDALENLIDYILKYILV